jgi:hypothetical protein
MNQFARKFYSKEAEDLFAPMLPTIIEDAQLAVEEVRMMVSDPCYVEPLTLTVSWMPSNKLEANASTRGPDQHGISLAYGLAVMAYKDAATLYTLALTHFNLDAYQELFSGIDYGQGPKQVFPMGLGPKSAREKFLRSSIAWVFLHEQAHLFQNHGPIFASRTGQTIPFGHTDWVDDKQGAELAGDAAWIRHCFELSADYEASVQAIGYLLVKDEGSLERSSLWMLVAAVTCLFRHFYGETRGPQSDSAKGSHPDPDARARVALSAMINTLWHPQVRAHISWAKTRDDIEKVMYHAFVTASLYMQLVHFDPEQFPQFLTRLREDSSSRRTYEAGLKKMWDSLRPDVVAAHFGPEAENAMPAFD